MFHWGGKVAIPNSNNIPDAQGKNYLFGYFPYGKGTQEGAFTLYRLLSKCWLFAETSEDIISELTVLGRKRSHGFFCDSINYQYLFSRRSQYICSKINQHSNIKIKWVGETKWGDKGGDIL